jgi:hypothetical protein
MRTSPTPPTPRVIRRVNGDASHPTQAAAAWRAATQKQLARSVDGLSATMLKPIVTTSTNDISYVDEVIGILADVTLLPLDPDGELSDIVSTLGNSFPIRQEGISLRLKKTFRPYIRFSNPDSPLPMMPPKLRHAFPHRRR